MHRADREARLLLCKGRVKMKILCVIPARYASTRLPGKPLAKIAGKPMIQHVYEKAIQASIPDRVVVATDHEKVYEAVQTFGGEVVMTSVSHPTGTDRLAEVAELFPDADVFINVQGDEPLLPPEVIDLLAGAFLADPELNMATLKTPMTEEDYLNPNAVKVTTDQKDDALYFSRSLIPYPRVKPEGYQVYRHIGIYGYKRDFLLQFANMQPTPLERAESLEQLRALENGYKIKVLTTKYHALGVDTAEDLAKVNALLTGGN